MRRFIIDSSHELHIHNDSFSVYSGDIRLFRFFVQSPVPTAANSDENETVRLVESSETKAVWYGENGAWAQKEYTVRLIEKGFVFTTKLIGNGTPEKIDYFKGDCNSNGSRFGVAGYMLPMSQNYDKKRAVKLMDVEPAEITPLRTAPPPFVFPFFNDYNEDWCGIGVSTRAGNHNFQRFILNAPKNGWNENGCYFTLPLGGYTNIINEWKAPTIWCGFGQDGNDIVKLYSKWSYNHYGFNKNSNIEQPPEWWKKPIFCGWGEQCAIRDASHESKKAPDYCTQQNYEQFIKKLCKLNLNPGTVIIDDKWQKQYGTLEPDTDKWHNLREFADKGHEENRKTLLWIKSWDAEGLPDDECIFINGERFSADPTNPKYIQRLTLAVHKLLSSDENCYNCDGFKIDFFDNHPRTEGAETYIKGVAGLELMHMLLEIIYKAAKEAKPDALINTSCAHPYFAEFCDQYRLHDFDPTLRNPISCMEYRADIALSVMPGVLIDTDGFSAHTANEQIRIIEAASRIGIPDLYFFPSYFGEKEWSRVRKVWEEHS